MYRISESPKTCPSRIDSLSIKQIYDIKKSRQFQTKNIIFCVRMFFSDNLTSGKILNKNVYSENNNSSMIFLPFGLQFYGEYSLGQIL